ncbi:MAG: MBL fold metallo-hydrolase [Myxococcales bacterium]|nr:MBL fold metallo-hydrolase [Myxococcales bacterium]
MEIKALFHSETFTLTYVVWDPETKEAAIIDPVLDYDTKASQTSTAALEELCAFIDEAGLRPQWIFETHAHADHVSGSQYLRRRYDAGVAIGHRITEVQKTFKGIFDFDPEFPVDGSQFDRLVRHGERIPLGKLEIEVIETPGHTPACVSYKVGDAVFVGDALFMEDFGTGRCDFPAGSAENLYDSVHGRLYSLPDETRLFVGHDYQPGGRELRYETTVGSSKAGNKQLKGETSREEFVRFRTERDATLQAPRLLLPSVQINVDAGRMPTPRANGKRYLNIPINLFHPSDEVGEPQ